MSDLRVFAIRGVGEIREGDSLHTIFLEALEKQGETLIDHDVVIVTSKVVSKAEGRVVPFDGTDDHKLALIGSESRRILRQRGTLRILSLIHISYSWATRDAKVASSPGPGPVVTTTATTAGARESMGI